MTAVHTVRGRQLPAPLNMATPIIWLRYHRSLPFTFDKITDTASRQSGGWLRGFWYAAAPTGVPWLQHVK